MTEKRGDKYSSKYKLSISNPKFFDAIKMLISILIALAITFVILCMVSSDPVNAIVTILTGPLTKTRYIGAVIESHGDRYSAGHEQPDPAPDSLLPGRDGFRRYRHDPAVLLKGQVRYQRNGRLLDAQLHLCRCCGIRSQNLLRYSEKRRQLF